MRLLKSANSVIGDGVWITVIKKMLVVFQRTIFGQTLKRGKIYRLHDFLAFAQAALTFAS
jgi:hypothetical protein